MKIFEHLKTSLVYITSSFLGIPSPIEAHIDYENSFCGYPGKQEY